MQPTRPYDVSDFIVDVLEEVGDVFAPKKEGGSKERKELLGLIGKIQPYRHRLEAAIAANAATIKKAERERVFEGTSKALHDTYFAVINGIADGIEVTLPDTAKKVRMIADKARNNLLDDVLAEAATINDDKRDVPNAKH